MRGMTHKECADDTYQEIQTSKYVIVSNKLTNTLYMQYMANCAHHAVLS